MFPIIACLVRDSCRLARWNISRNFDLILQSEIVDRREGLALGIGICSSEGLNYRYQSGYGLNTTKLHSIRLKDSYHSWPALLELPNEDI